MKVFLGGTCSGSRWRDELIPQLKCDYFNPVVEDWTPECQEEERRQRQECDVVLYVITPLMRGGYSIAEAVEDAIKHPEKTVFCLKAEDEIPDLKTAIQEERAYSPGQVYCFDDRQQRWLRAVGEMVERNGGEWVNWDDLPAFLEYRARELDFGLTLRNEFADWIWRAINGAAYGHSGNYSWTMAGGERRFVDYREHNDRLVVVVGRRPSPFVNEGMEIVYCKSKLKDLTQVDLERDLVEAWGRLCGGDQEKTHGYVLQDQSNGAVFKYSTPPTPDP